MAESTPKKATPRKTPAKGPTKAQALKALGLTNDELNAFKAAATELAAIKAQQAAQNVPAEEAPEPAYVQSEAVRDRNPQQYLEDRLPPQPIPVETPVPEQREPVWYIRNLRHVDVSFRLSRQEDTSKKRTSLKPRGQRGDIVKLEPGDLHDIELQTQVQYQLVEVIPEGEAREAISKQYTNAQTVLPSHIAALRNELGQPYNIAPRTLSDEESMGYAVANLDPRLMQGRLSDKEIARGAGFSDGIMQPVQNPRPGSILSDGFMAPAQPGMGNQSDNERAQAVDALARSKQFEGPGAGLGEVTVRVVPTQKG